MAPQPFSNFPEFGASTIPALALLIDGFERVQELVPSVVDDLSVDDLTWRPDAAANSIGWLVWHLTRVQDDHLADIADEEQVWTSQGWSSRFALPYETDSIGYGQSSKEMGDFRLEDPALLTGYHAAVSERTSKALSGMPGTELDRVIDQSYDPPVTVAARLVSVLNDTTQHIGQAAYVKGLVERRR